MSGYVGANLDFVAAHRAWIRAVAEVALNLRGSDGGLRFGPGADDPVVEHLAGLLRAARRTARSVRSTPAVSRS